MKPDMSFLENIFERLGQRAGEPVLREIRDGKVKSASGSELLGMVQEARNLLKARGLKKKGRCALLGSNSIRWVALDLAMMAEGIVVVPLYSRQAPAELVAMLKDSGPARIFCSNAKLSAEITKQWPGAAHITLFDTVFAGQTAKPAPVVPLADSDVLTIIYTSGTSGESKGVILNAANVNYMLGCTNARLDQLMSQHATQGPDEIFHYAPFCFAASWILLLTALSRNSVLTLSTDVSKIADDLKISTPDYFLNVPTLLERVRAKIVETIQKRGGFAAFVFSRAQQGYIRQQNNETRGLDSLLLWLARRVMLPEIRKSIGSKLRALICGSAPLSVETQLYFLMLGIPVLQVYGLTETTAICTMDDPDSAVVPGRAGPAIAGVEMEIAENSEIVVRGPNIFPGYWNRPEETAKVLRDGRFYTGDQGEVDANGNWKIVGRIKNLIILGSGHK